MYVCIHISTCMCIHIYIKFLLEELYRNAIQAVFPFQYISVSSPYFDVVMTMKNGKKDFANDINTTSTYNQCHWFISLITTMISYCLENVQLDSVAVVVKTLHSK